MGAGGLGASPTPPMLQKGSYCSNGSGTASLPSVWYNSVIFGWSQHVVWAWWLEGKEMETKSQSGNQKLP